MPAVVDAGVKELNETSKQVKVNDIQHKYEAGYTF